jgi:hypothetical protein
MNLVFISLDTNKDKISKEYVKILEKKQMLREYNRTRMIDWIDENIEKDIHINLGLLLFDLINIRKF